MREMTPEELHSALMDATLTEKAYADALRKFARPMLEEIADIMQKAKERGFAVSFDISPDPKSGRMRCGDIIITKTF